MTRYPISVQRIYDKPVSGQGYRVLVDALWPRGMKREAAALDLWLRAIAPSADLRKWFNHQDERWMEFRRRYEQELQEAERAKAYKELQALAQSRPVVLLYAAKNREHNNAVALKELLGR